MAIETTLWTETDLEWEIVFVLCPCSCTYLCICDFEKSKKEGERKTGRAGVDGGLSARCCAAARCVALQRDNRTLAPLAYLCCTQRSCLLLPAKSHPATTWGRRSAPPGPCSSSSAPGQITNTNHLLILVIKGTLISSELGSSAALNGQKHTSTCACSCVCVCFVACRQWLYSGCSGDKRWPRPLLSERE